MFLIFKRLNYTLSGSIGIHHTHKVKVGYLDSSRDENIENFIFKFNTNLRVEVSIGSQIILMVGDYSLKFEPTGQFLDNENWNKSGAKGLCPTLQCSVDTPGYVLRGHFWWCSEMIWTKLTTCKMCDLKPVLFPWALKKIKISCLFSSFDN